VRRHIANVLTIDSRDTLRESPKKHNLIPILEAFPERQFVLVGDSTELDADIYVDLYEGTNWPSRFQAPANGYKDRIKKIYIRDVKNSTNRAAAVKALARIGDREIADFFDPDQPRLLEKVLPLFSGARI
jgi:phosphatidate phosphatase APP1